MDRKAWIIVSLCVIALCINIYYGNQNREIAQRDAAQQQKQEQTSPAANAPQSGTPGLVVLPDPADPAAKTWDMVVTRDINGEIKPVTKFTFSNVGGSLRSVEMIGSAIDSRKVPDSDVVINESTETFGIGTLVYGMSASSDPAFDTAIYTRVDKEDQPGVIQFGRKTDDGLYILKEYHLEHINDNDHKQLKGSDYMVRLKISIFNSADQPKSLTGMGIFAGGGYPVAKSEQSEAFTHFFYMQDGSFTQETPGYFTGGFFSNARAREFVTKPDITYAGVMSQYYVTVLMPLEGSRGETVFAKRKMFHLVHQKDQEVPGVELALGAPSMEIRPNETRKLEYTIYTGPKLNQVLRDLPKAQPGVIPDGISKVMAYGWFTILSEPMNWLLNLFHGWFGNWGLAIICMTIVVRICIWPLHKKSYMSMKRMSLVQPKLQELKEKYGNDQQKMSMEMMNLYKKYGINPLSGCVPMLFQIPIFFAFYRVLQYSAELRGEPFILWVKDLSLPDTVYEIPLPFESFTHLPINILPVVMAVTMIIQMKMTPQAGDKMQQRIMAFMPWMFFLFCYNFASALALYWTIQNLISMLQTQLIRRLPQPELTSGKTKKPGRLQKWLERQRQLMEQQQQQAGKQGKGGNMRNVTPGKK